MRVNEIGVYSMFEELSPAAYHAQRMAELKDIAEFRRRKLDFYKAWSDPSRRGAMISELEGSSYRAKEEMAGKTVQLLPRRHLKDIVAVTPVAKAPPKLTWREHFSKWLWFK